MRKAPLKSYKDFVEAVLHTQSLNKSSIVIVLMKSPEYSL